MDMIYMVAYIGAIISCFMLGFAIIEKVISVFPSLDVILCKFFGCEED